MSFDLIKSVALLLSLSYLQSFNYLHNKNNQLLYKVITGLLFGLITTLAMMTPVELYPGVIFDPRSVIISLVGFFYGGLSTIIAALIAISYRAYLGGVGTFTGILVICACTIVGLAFHHYSDKIKINNHYLLLLIFGFLVDVMVIICFLTLPESIRWGVIQKITLPFLLILPPATVFLGGLLWDIEKRYQTQQKLIESEHRYRHVLRTKPLPR